MVGNQKSKNIHFISSKTIQTFYIKDEDPYFYVEAKDYPNGIYKYTLYHT